MADNLMEELTLLNFPLDDDGDFYLDEPIWADVNQLTKYFSNAGTSQKPRNR